MKLAVAAALALLAAVAAWLVLEHEHEHERVAPALAPRGEAERSDVALAPPGRAARASRPRRSRPRRRAPPPRSHPSAQPVPIEVTLVPFVPSEPPPNVDGLNHLALGTWGLAGSVFEIELVDATTGAPIRDGPQAWLQYGGARVAFPLRSGGRTRLSLGAGRDALEVQVEGYAPVAFELDVPLDGFERLTLPLEPTGGE